MFSLEFWTTSRFEGQIGEYFTKNFHFSETENIEAIKEQNDAYSLLCANREGNDKYISNGMQTFNNKLKDKQTLTSPIMKSNQSSQASKSILWDAHNTTDEPAPGMVLSFLN